MRGFGKVTAFGARLWRHPFVQMLLGAAVIIGAMIGLSIAATRLPFTPGTPAHALVAAGIALVLLLLYAGFRRFVERTAVTDLPLRPAAIETSAGLLIGFSIFSVAAAIVALFGGVRVIGWGGVGDLWPMIAMAITSATFEEILFRGILLRQIERMAGWGMALAITSALFGAAHILNPDATWWAATAIMVEAGVLLGAAYFVTRHLWLAIGIHAGWNFTQGWVFGLPVSGGKAPDGLLRTVRAGPDWLTGGGFGLEASVVLATVATLAGVTLLAAALHRGRIAQPRWSGRE